MNSFQSTFFLTNSVGAKFRRFLKWEITGSVSMSLAESDKSAANWARWDSVLTRKGWSTYRCVWTFSRSSEGVANKSSEVELRPWFETLRFGLCSCRRRRPYSCRGPPRNCAVLSLSGTISELSSVVIVILLLDVWLVISQASCC